MKKALVIIDMQNDFIDGALGTDEAKKIVPKVIEFIEKWNDPIFITKDTHGEDYLDTPEGKKLPVKHCIQGTQGWELNEKVQEALNKKEFHKFEYHKPTFGSIDLMDDLVRFGFDEIVFFGLCTDICVVSNVLMAKAFLPNTKIEVKADCCAGVTQETHEAALKTMQMCQVDII